MSTLSETGPRTARLQESWRDLRRDLGPEEATNGLVGLLFSVTGPVAVILAVGRSGDLAPATVASWIFAVFTLNGALTVAASLVHRQPLCFFWTIPGTVVVGQALASGMPWAEVVGSYLLTAALILAVGLSGQVDRVMALLPMPIVMAMVAGVFLQFGLDLVAGLQQDLPLAAPMVLAFLVSRAVPTIGRYVPATLAALLAGAAAVLASGRMAPDAVEGRWLVVPVWHPPVFTLSSVAELVIPLAITVLVVQNGQGMGVLRAAGHRPPMNQVTVACGVLSFPTAVLGGVSTCLTGPTNALLTASGSPRRHYAAAVWCGLLAIGFGVIAPGMVRLMSATPEAFIAVLGGLAMLTALQGAFTTAFSGAFSTGALVCFLITVADVSIWHVGAPFWGLVIGLGVAGLLEPADFERRGA